jgi:hypothetical protein
MKVIKVPAAYLAYARKTITALAGDAVIYLQLYGTTWHLLPAVVMIAAALGIYYVPNATKPGPAAAAPPVA